MHHYHFIGIGGIGMSGLARILLNKHVFVSGSDLTTNSVTESLRAAGARIYKGHLASQVPEGATVIYSSDIKQDNPEYLAAQQLGCRILHRAELLADLMNEYKGLIVAGTHGKTTTTSLLTWVLRESGLDPSFSIGGILPTLQTNAAVGKGEYFVAEADESDGSFLHYHPWGAIITNIGLDHMNYFLTENALVTAFQSVMNHVASKKHLFWCGDDPRLKQLPIEGVSYGFGEKCEMRIISYEQKAWVMILDLLFRGVRYPNVQIPLIGRHNALNASAVFGLAIALGIHSEDIYSSLYSFTGVKRRCENRGVISGGLFLDDYAHHPTEIKTTLEGIRQVIGKKHLIAVYQPHRYTRVRDCLGFFSSVFNAVDELVMTEIYSAGEPVIPGVSHEKILAEVSQSVASRHIPRAELTRQLVPLLSHTKKDLVIVSLGAGDITHLATEMRTALGEK